MSSLFPSPQIDADWDKAVQLIDDFDWSSLLNMDDFDLTGKSGNQNSWTSCPKSSLIEILEKRNHQRFKSSQKSVAPFSLSLTFVSLYITTASWHFIKSMSKLSCSIPDLYVDGKVISDSKEKVRECSAFRTTGMLSETFFVWFRVPLDIRLESYGPRRASVVP